MATNLSKCPYCQFPIKDGVEAAVCPECGASHHEDCWSEGEGCAVTGCGGGAEAEVTRVIPQAPPPLAPPRPRRVTTSPDQPPPHQPAPPAPTSPTGSSGSGRLAAAAAGAVAGALIAAIAVFLIVGRDDSDNGAQEALSRARKSQQQAEAAQQNSADLNAQLVTRNQGLKTEIRSQDRTIEQLQNSASTVTPNTPAAPASTPSTPSATGPYIAQISSSRDRSTAEAYAAQLQDQGYPAEVLWSSDYPGLAPGWWVVYAGFFDESTADSYVAQARSLGDGDAFTRNTEG